MHILQQRNMKMNINPVFTNKSRELDITLPVTQQVHWTHQWRGFSSTNENVDLTPPGTTYFLCHLDRHEIFYSTKNNTYYNAYTEHFKYMEYEGHGNKIKLFQTIFRTWLASQGTFSNG